MSQKSMYIGNYYCGDVHVRGAYPAFVRRYWKENDIEIHMEKEDEAILKAGKVDFYTFSYYMSSCLSHEVLTSGKGNVFAGALQIN